MKQQRRAQRSTSSTVPADVSDVAALVRELYRDATAIAAGIGRSAGIHPTDADALRLLDLTSGRPTMGELGAALGLSSAAVTGLVDRLEHAGLARRVRDADDRRRVRVEPTEHARELFDAQIRPLGQRIRAAVAATDPADRVVVAAFLQRLLDRPGPSTEGGMIDP
jgi:DNA-binding MarR family transcriptional regulator